VAGPDLGTVRSPPARGTRGGSGFWRTPAGSSRRFSFGEGRGGFDRVTRWHWPPEAAWARRRRLIDRADIRWPGARPEIGASVPPNLWFRVGTEGRQFFRGRKPLGHPGPPGMLRYVPRWAAGVPNVFTGSPKINRGREGIPNRAVARDDLEFFLRFDLPLQRPRPPFRTKTCRKSRPVADVVFLSGAGGHSRKSVAGLAGQLIRVRRGDQNRLPKTNLGSRPRGFVI